MVMTGKSIACAVAFDAFKVILIRDDACETLV